MYRRTKVWLPPPPATGVSLETGIALEWDSKGDRSSAAGRWCTLVAQVSRGEERVKARLVTSLPPCRKPPEPSVPAHRCPGEQRGQFCIQQGSELSGKHHGGSLWALVPPAFSGGMAIALECSHRCRGSHAPPPSPVLHVTSFLCQGKKPQLPGLESICESPRGHHPQHYPR